MIDSHVHLVSFLQQPLAAASLAEALRGSLEAAVVFGLPVKKKWALSEPERPTYYLDDNAPCSTWSLTDELVADVVRELPDDVRGEVAPLICGFDPTDRLAADHVDLVAGRFDGWRGIGEVLLRHDDLTELTYGENARAGHPALDGVLDICAARGWAVTVHQDASSAGRSGGREYVGELLDTLRRHPRVPLVWAHAGASRRVRPDEHPRLVGELLDRHPQLHVDLSWVVVDDLVDDRGRPVESWLALVERHPDRFVVGSDVFGSLADQRRRLEQCAIFTGALGAVAGDLVERGNARRLWWS